MRNLKNIRHGRIAFPETSLPLTASAWDIDSDALICAFGPTEQEAVIELRRFGKDASKPDDSTLIASWDAPCPLPDLACDKILSLKYLAETQTSCLVLAGGDLVLVRERPQQGEDLIEIVGSVDAGVRAAAWSPDDELLAVATGADTLILMTRLFDSTANVALSPDDVKVSAHVSVGWGKKETQFHGKRARALRDPTVPEHVDEGVLSPFEDDRTTISWRGDGAYLAINRLDPIDDSSRRLIRVFSRDGVLDSVSEPVDGLEGALSWRPAGNLIAGVQNLHDRVDVVFFERNGLRHGQFTLRFDKEPRPSWAAKIDLAWNHDSTVLAISFMDRIQLWTMNNYHYYLKQEIKVTAQPRHLQTAWHPEKVLQLASYWPSGLSLLGYRTSTGDGSVLPPQDYGLVPVIDGRLIKLTPLRLANIPPPMALLEVEVSSNILDVATSEDSSRIAMLLQDSVEVVELDLDGLQPNSVKLTHSLSLKHLGRPDLMPRQVVIGAEGNTVILAGQKNSRRHTLMISQQNQMFNVIDLATNDQVISLHTSLDQKLVIAQVAPPNGPGSSLQSLEILSGSLSPILRLPNICPSVKIWQSEQELLMFGLTGGGALYAFGGSHGGISYDQRLHIKGVTSFLISQSHLIYTTTSHLVKFVHLHEGMLEVPLDEPEKDERCRSIERGARLVTVMPSKYSLVLQMPRGNLETIFPRALVLAGIRKAILDKDYRKAFFACRNHRVDMNIIHDYAPTQFMTSIGLFIDQVKKPVHIDLFLSQLRNEDVSQTLYKDTLEDFHVSTDTTQRSGAPLVPLVQSKINRICVGFIDVLSGRHKTHLQNVVTAYVSQVPADLEAGLQLISGLRQSSSADADRAVEHICFLADVNRLYDTALGLYDLDVALLVAQQSQKDPREYLPYLQSLQEKSEVRRKYAIDNDLKRHVKALGWLHQMNEFEEMKRYIARHELYAASVELIKYDKARLAEVMRLQADWLMVGNRNRDAAIAYEFLQDYEAASDAYKAATLWREALSCAQLAGKSKDEVKDVAKGLAEGLAESKDWADAAKVYIEYLDDPQNAAACFCKAYLFSDAIATVANRGKVEFLTSVVDPGLADAFATTSEMLAEMKGQVAAQRSRLSELRIKKSEDPRQQVLLALHIDPQPVSFYDEAPTGNSGNADIPDDVSLAPSGATTSAGTFMTRYTNRTTSTLATNTTRRSSKNRRREERKRARGKKGSVYEEEYLVASTGRLVERLNDIAGDVGRLVEGCMRRGMRERAVAVQRLMVEVREAVAEALPEVYEVVADQRGGVVGDGAGMEGGGVEGAAGEKQVKIVPPVVKAFEGLSLIS